MPKRMLSYEAKVITFITSNPRKKKIFENLFKDQDVMVITKNIKIPEIQADDSEEVVSFATKYCSQLLNSPVVKIDTGFFVEELNGFPGPFVHYIDKQLGCEKFLKILKGAKNRKAYIKVALGYCEPGEKPVIFSHKIPGVIVDKIKYKEGSFIDKLFIPIHKRNSEMKTMGEIRKEKPEIINEIWGNIENKFAQWFIKNKL
jgi:XTP/dITP diphosphohydrolase